jgi:hypothetical protein
MVLGQALRSYPYASALPVDWNQRPLLFWLTKPDEQEIKRYIWRFIGSGNCGRRRGRAAASSQGDIEQREEAPARAYSTAGSV